MLWFVYKTVCKIDGKYYIGKHQTENLDDGYLGSGKLLVKAIAKHGKLAFTREVLKMCGSLNELNDSEKAFITEEILMDPMSFNLALGGQGGDLSKHRLPMSAVNRASISEKAKARWANAEWKRDIMAKRVGLTHNLNTTQRANRSKIMKDTIRKCWENEDHREKMRQVAKTRPATDAFKFATKGRKWMNHHEFGRKLVKEVDQNALVDCGWRYGKKL
jgi:hypothetical protein